MRELSPPAIYVASSRGEQKDKNEDEAGRLLVLYSAAVLCPVRAQVEDNHTSVDTHLYIPQMSTQAVLQSDINNIVLGDLLGIWRESVT